MHTAKPKTIYIWKNKDLYSTKIKYGIAACNKQNIRRD